MKFIIRWSTSYRSKSYDEDYRTGSFEIEANNAQEAADAAYFSVKKDTIMDEISIDVYTEAGEYIPTI